MGVVTSVHGCAAAGRLPSSHLRDKVGDERLLCLFLSELTQSGPQLSAITALAEELRHRSPDGARTRSTLADLALTQSLRTRAPRHRERSTVLGESL